MKKFYLSLLGLLSLITMSAQTVTVFSNNGANQVNNGDVVVASDLEKDEEDCYELSSGLFYKGDTDGEITVKCNFTKAETDYPFESDFSLCCGGLCDKVTTDDSGSYINKTFNYYTNSGKADLFFDYAPNGGYPIAETPKFRFEIEMSIFYTSNPENACNFTLVMTDSDSSAVKNLLFDAADDSVDIYDLTGSKVKTIELSESGKIDTAGLAKGIYVYRSNNKAQKVIIK